MNVFRLTHEMHGVIELVRVTGSLDMDTFPRLEKFITTEFQHKHFAVLLDCRNLNYVATIALGGLIKFTKQARENGGDFKLVNVPERVFKIIDLLGFTKVLQIYTKEEEALASFTKR